MTATARQVKSVKIDRELAQRLEKVRTKLEQSWSAFILHLLDEYCLDHPDDIACRHYQELRQQIPELRPSPVAGKTRFASLDKDKFIIKIHPDVQRVLALFKVVKNTTYSGLLKLLLDHFCSKHPDLCQ